jgi:Uncharacterized proteins, homologs of lactam utilization protein B
MPIVNLNADVGETFGAHEYEFDQSILDIVQSVSIACGMYAGDPPTMHFLTKLAAERDVSFGAHPGYNDLWGYGRRRIDMDPRHLEYLVAYQIGALQALASYHGKRVTHVKAHAALYNYAVADRASAMAIARATKTVDPSMVLVALSGSEMEKAGRELGLLVAREGFCDRLYENDGSLTPRIVTGAVIKDAEQAAQQALRMVKEGTVLSRQGECIPVAVDTLCVHANEPTAVALGKAVHRALSENHVQLVSLLSLKLT